MKMTFFKRRGGMMRSLVMIATIGLFIILVGISIFNAMFSSKDYVADLIVRDVNKLATIFEHIDKHCKILSFEYQKNPINFLNVKEFSGSEVGPMNLAHPERWEGPYLEDNPTMQEKEYLIVRTKKGYFITPGEGVILPNGKEIGKDNLVLNEDTNIRMLMTDPQALMFKDRVFAAPVMIGVRTKLSRSPIDDIV